MKLLKTILLAMDVDDTSEALLAALTKLAKPFHSEVVMLHVLEPAGSTLFATSQNKREVRS